MFKKENAKKTKEAVYEESVSVIAFGTTMKGEVETKGILVVEGNFIGDVLGCKKVVVGAKGKIQGNFNVDVALVFGTVEGSIEVNELLEIKTSGVVIGEIMTNRLAVENGGVINGNCQMNTVVKVSEDANANANAPSGRQQRKPAAKRGLGEQRKAPKIQAAS